jgi:hypothetical protein
MAMGNPWHSEDGRKAYQVLDWVNENPAARAAEGMTRLGGLADAAQTTRSLHEVQDVARVVNRLIPAGGADGGPGPDRAVPPGVGPG